jgi:hypothetical protein
MSKAQLVITAVVLEGRRRSDVARDAGVTEVPAVATIRRILSRRGFITPCRIVRRSAADQRCRRGPDVGGRGVRRSGGGRPIADDRLDVELALLVCEWYGNAVLSADGAQ